METIRYAALLKSINVSGQKLIKMEVLKQLFASMGFTNIVTYIQSGNILFDSILESEQQLVKIIDGGLFDGLGYAVTVIVRSVDDLKKCIQQNPFAGLTKDDDRKLSVTFLSCKPLVEKVGALPRKSGETDEVVVLDREAYILYKAYSDSKLSNAYLEKKLGVLATTRNWATVNKIVNL